VSYHVEAEMAGSGAGVRDVAVLKAARVDRVAETRDPLRPFELLDEDGTEVPAVAAFLHHMLADEASPASLRSYAYKHEPASGLARAIGRWIEAKTPETGGMSCNTQGFA
jgi:hypothetical protein